MLPLNWASRASNWLVPHVKTHKCHFKGLDGLQWLWNFAKSEGKSPVDFNRGELPGLPVATSSMSLVS